MISFSQYLEEARVHPDLAAHGITPEHIKNFMALQKASASIGDDPYSATKGQRISHGRARNKFWGDESLTNAQRNKIYSHYDTHGAKGMMEAKSSLPSPEPLAQKSFQDVSKSLGKGKTNAMLKHPWLKEYGSWDQAYKHGVSSSNFHEVEVYPYMRSSHTTSDGKVRPTTMLRFHFSDKGVSQVHKFTRDKDNLTSNWKHSKSWKEEK